MTTPSPQEVTQLLLAWSQGDQAALDQLIPLVHAELHRLAHRCMDRERAGHTLQTTALVNEAYLRLIDQKHVNWQNRAHFVGVAAQMMRRILVDHAKSHNRAKRGGGALRVTLDENLAAGEERGDDLLELDEALTALEAFDKRKSKVVEMKYFGGLSVEETAEVLKVSVITVARDWKLAKAWLLTELSNRG